MGYDGAPAVGPSAAMGRGEGGGGTGGESRHARHHWGRPTSHSGPPAGRPVSRSVSRSAVMLEASAEVQNTEMQDARRAGERGERATERGRIPSARETAGQGLPRRKSPPGLRRGAVPPWVSPCSAPRGELRTRCVSVSPRSLPQSATVAGITAPVTASQGVTQRYAAPRPLRGVTARHTERSRGRLSSGGRLEQLAAARRPRHATGGSQPGARGSQTGAAPAGVLPAARAAGFPAGQAACPERCLWRRY